MASSQALRLARSCWAWILAAMLGGGLAFASSGSAAVMFTVDSVLDQVDDNPTDGICHTTTNHCTLRAAIMSANRASGAGATIVLPAGIYTLVAPASVADGDDVGDLNLSIPAGYAPGPTTIVGANAATTIIDANGIDRVLGVAAGRTANISGVTFRNGSVSQCGGGINNAGTLTLDKAAVITNVAGQRGGGICNAAGTLTISRSTIDGNATSASGGGGGLYSEALMQVFESTISNNTANDGGGIFVLSGTTFITNSTIALNNAYRDGGGIYSEKTSNIYSTTIVWNQAAADDASGGSGGGIYNLAPHTFNLSNSVVAGNYLSGTPTYDDCAGTFGFYGNNSLWTASGCTGSGASTGSVTLVLSLAQLGPLQNNGGPTKTVALVAPSNLIDSGDAVFGCYDQDGVPLATDQRGHLRVYGVRCDVGAFEYDGFIFANGFE